jgi:uncharacterized SAM-binding protein YcdF (DUF218 family)
VAPIDVTAAGAGATRGRRRRKIAGLTLGAVALSAIVLAYERAAVLTWIGSQLVVEDQLTPADAILPLTGGIWDREIEVAELFRGGYARNVIMTVEPEAETLAYLADRGIQLPTGEELRLQMFARLGVPRDRITVIREPVTSTIEEARIVGAWAARAGVRTVIIVSSAQHTARAKETFERYAATPQIKFIVRPARLSQFKPDSWWTRRDMLREGIFELEKRIAYRLWY